MEQAGSTAVVGDIIELNSSTCSTTLLLRGGLHSLARHQHQASRPSSPSIDRSTTPCVSLSSYFSSFYNVAGSIVEACPTPRCCRFWIGVQSIRPKGQSSSCMRPGSRFRLRRHGGLAARTHKICLIDGIGLGRGVVCNANRGAIPNGPTANETPRGSVNWTVPRPAGSSRGPAACRCPCC